MVDRTATDAYEVLLSTFRQHGLDWVAEQIQEHVQAGLSIDTRVKGSDVVPSVPLESSNFTLESQPRSSRKRGLTTRPYSAEECLDIAIDALEAITAQTTEIEKHIVDFFEEQPGSSFEVRFDPDELDRSADLAFSRPSDSRIEAVEEMKGLISKIRDRERQE